MTEREEFLDIFHRYVTRPGSEKLLDWLDTKTDFFTAPASTRFHGAYDGGLCAHSLNVYRVLRSSFFEPDTDTEETYAIVALLHDLCKANFYKKGTRNVKNDETGKWEKVPSYSVEDMFPYGHGEKSVFLIERFMKLKVEEAVPSAGIWAASTTPSGAEALPCRGLSRSTLWPSSCISPTLRRRI